MGIIRSDRYSYYRVVAGFSGDLMGGLPADPRVIQDWIAKSSGAAPQDLIAARVEQHMEMNMERQKAIAEADAALAAQDAIVDAFGAAIAAGKAADAAIEAVASERGMIVFARDANGLYIESRQAFACFREAIAVLWPGERRGATRKGFKSLAVEQTEVWPQRIYLDRMEPDEVQTRVIHANTPRGPIQSLGRAEIVRGAVITFYFRTLSGLGYAITLDEWEAILEHMGVLGLGAGRSQQKGKFDVWDFSALNLEEAERVGLLNTTMPEHVRRAIEAANLRANRDPQVKTWEEERKRIAALNKARRAAAKAKTAGVEDDDGEATDAA